MRLKYSLIFIVMYFLSSSQGGFRSRFKLPNVLNNTSKAIFESSPGNNYITGGIVYDSLNGFNFNRLVIMGLNSSGHLQWQKRYGNKNFEYLDNTFISRSFYKKGNNIFHTACVRDSNNKYVGVLMKFDLNGDTLWQRIYRNADTMELIIPQMLSSSVDGGFLITGIFENFSGTGRFCMLIKTDAEGKELWRKKISKTSYPNTQDGKAVLQDSASKKIVIVGYQYIGNQSSWSSYDNLMILDSLGNKLSQHHYIEGFLRDLIQTKDKKFVAVGSVMDFFASESAYYYYSYVFKFDINNPGQALWRIPYFDKVRKVNYFSCVTELANGDILIAGNVDTSSAVTGTLQVLDRFTRINPSGTVVSNRYYNYALNSSTYYNTLMSSLSNTSDGGWVAACRITNLQGSSPFFFVKYDSTGCDSTTAYCLNPTGLEDLKKSNDLFSVYPNPTKGVLMIDLKGITATGSEIELTIVDVLGKKVLHKTLSALDKSSIAELDLSAFEKGIYFVQIFKEKKLIVTQKLIKE